MPSPLLPLLLAAACGAAQAAAKLQGLSNYTQYANTDVTPCQPPCDRVGSCGYGYNVTCDVAVIAALCDAACGCVAFNSNGWLKGCGNASCGAIFEGSSGTDTYIRGDGVPPASPDIPVADIDDVHYPPEEPGETGGSPAVLALSSGVGCWAVLQDPAGTDTANTTCGGGAFGFVLQAVLGEDTAVVERTFARWGFLAYVSLAGGETARFRKGTGAVPSLVMPNYNALAEADCLYWSKVGGGPTDYLRGRIMADTAGQPTFAAAAKFMTSQRDYGHIGAVQPYQKYSVSPDGRIKLADGAIYTTDAVANETGPGTLVWDPALYVPLGLWPLTNFTFSKSALVGNWLRVVSVTSFSPATGNGFEQTAFAPASDLAGRVLLRLQPYAGNATAGRMAYFCISALGEVEALSDPSIFYSHLLAEGQLWNATFLASPGFVPASYALPGQEGRRQVDMTWGGMLSSLSLFVDLEPNYGDGLSYWTPGGNNGGNLPFQTVNLNLALQSAGLLNRSADLIEFYFDSYIVNGTYSTGTWELSCPDGFADAKADHGILMALLARTVTLVLGSNGLPPVRALPWVQAQMVTLGAMATYALDAKANASAAGPPTGDPAHGLIWGSPEHDTCREAGYYYHNNVWFVRGMVEAGVLINNICGGGGADYCPSLAPLGAPLLASAAGLKADILASLNLTVTRNATTGAVVFVPPVAVLGFAPFVSMIESVIAEYSNFRYYAELLGADVLPADLAVPLMDFRETHTGTVSGITRWNDHLDDMPSVHYLSSSLWHGRQPFFWSLTYGHIANYHGRGTFTATEQLPIGPDAIGFSRDYLWVYLEGGIDECVPSIMLPALSTQMALVTERYDAEALFLGYGVPGRWVDVDASPTTYAVTNAVTRFGTVSLSGANVVAGGGGTETATVVVSFTPTGSPGMTTTPLLCVRIPAVNSTHALSPSVAVAGNGVAVVDVDTSASVAAVAISPPLAVGQTVSFTLTATLVEGGRSGTAASASPCAAA